MRWHWVDTWRAVACAALCLQLGGCANFGYYLQSMRGQFDVLQRARDIDAVVADEETPEVLRQRLAAAARARAFASRELNLPDNGTFRRYADIGRPYVVWNVFAAPEFAIAPRQWCFPFAGCVTYRGYFDKAAADDFAAAAAAAGDDVFVGGVPAYSTLGWFDDPLLNTFIHYPEPELARLIFHELAHQVVYVRNDTDFNESFAVAVEREGMRRWLAQHGAPELRDRYEVFQSRRAAFLALIEQYRGRLGALYASGLPAETMRARKQALFDTMQSDYGELKKSWGGFAGYDRWLGQRPNNALLASIAIYHRWVPAFEALLARSGGDLPRFYETVRELSRQDAAARTATLLALMPAGVAPTPVTAGPFDTMRQP